MQLLVVKQIVLWPVKCVPISITKKLPPQNTMDGETTVDSYYLASSDGRKIKHTQHHLYFSVLFSRNYHYFYYSKITLASRLRSFHLEPKMKSDQIMQVATAC